MEGDKKIYIGLDGKEYTADELVRYNFINIGGIWSAGPRLSTAQLHALHKQGRTLADPIEVVTYRTADQILEEHCDSLSESDKAKLKALRDAVPKFDKEIMKPPMIFGAGGAIPEGSFKELWDEEE